MNKLEQIINKLTNLPADFNAEALTDEDVEKVVSSINENFKLRLLNVDPNENNFYSSTKKEILNKDIQNFEQNLKSKIKKSFMLDDKEVEGKDLDKIFEHVNSKIHQSSDLKNNELIMKLQSANDKLEEYETKVIPSIKQQMDNELNKQKIDFNLKSLMSEHKNDLNVKPELIYDSFKNVLNSKYNIKYDDYTNNIVIKSKNDGEVFEGSKLLSNRDIILKELKELDVIRKSNNSTETISEKSILKGVEQIVNQNKSKAFNASAVEAAKQRLEELRKMS